MSVQEEITSTSYSDDAILSFADWCRLVGITENTGRRIRAAGNGPRVIQISENRIGITMADHRAWLASRGRK